MKKYRFDAYKAEARPTPFVLEVEPGDELVIEPPDAETVLKIDEARSARRVLELLCGEHYRRVIGLIGKEHVGVLNALVSDMTRHFNLDHAPAGGSGASST